METIDSVGDTVGGIVLVGRPLERDTAGGGGSNGDTFHFQAGRNLLEGHIVNIDNTCAAVHHNHHIGIVGSGSRQGNRVLGVGVSSHSDAVNHTTVIQIGGSDIDNLAGGSTVHSGPEAETVAVHRIGVHIHLGQTDGHHRRIVGAGRTCEVKTAAATMGIGGTTVGIRIVDTSGGSLINVALGAPRQSVNLGGTPNLFSLEATSPRQSHGCTGGAAADVSHRSHITSSAVGHHTKGVSRVGIKTRDGVTQTGGRSGRNAGGNNSGVRDIVDSVGGIGIEGVGPREGQTARGGQSFINDKILHLAAASDCHLGAMEGGNRTVGVVTLAGRAVERSVGIGVGAVAVPGKALVVARAGGAGGKLVRVAIVAGGVVMHNHHQVALAVIDKRRCEGESVPAMGAVEGTAVDKNGIGRDILDIRVRCKHSLVCVLEIDSHISCLRHRVGCVVVVTDARDVHRAADFVSTDDHLTQGIVVVGVHRHSILRRGRSSVSDEHIHGCSLCLRCKWHCQERQKHQSS